MDTLKVIVSKANSIRFAHIDGLMPSMDNTLWCEESWSDIPGIFFPQVYFKDDDVLIQIKAGLTATVTLKQYDINNNLIATLVADDTTTYTNFKIYDYLVTLDTLGEYFFYLTTEESTWRSEIVEVIDDDSEYKLIQWTNYDENTSNFEFDYTTTYAKNNVNYIRLLAKDVVYSPSIDKTVYDNQNEKDVIKAFASSKIRLETDFLPRQFAEKIVIAMQHDAFLYNEVAYIVEEAPEIEQSGAWHPITADMEQKLSLGSNTHDIGFDCDTVNTSNVEVKEIEGATGNGSFTVTAGYAVIGAVIEKVSGTPILKIGSSIAGDEILTQREIEDTTPPGSSNVFYTPDFDDASWTIYYTLSGGTINLSIVTIPYRQ